MNIFDWLNVTLMLIFAACCCYQFLYIPISWWKKPKMHKETQLHHYAVLVAARNEAPVIEELIRSIRQQDYPSELVDIYVMADNCTDDTAAIAEQAGATVYRRFNHNQIGKGYVLHDLYEKMKEEGRFSEYDGFFVFDADNVLRKNYISEMNRSFSDGYPVVTGYRNSKNFGDSWVSSGIALWFLRESRYLNYSRHLIGSSAAIGGTGFLAARELIERYDGWNFFTLTEDLEFTSRVVTDGYRIAFCREAELYDEQPIDLRTSWRQRMRWTRGYLQTMRKYGKALFLGVFRKDSPQRFACYDLLMNTIPPIVLGVVGLFLNVGKFFFVMGQGAAPDELVLPILQAIGSGYLMMFLMGALTVISEWKHIHAATGKKLLYMLTFPLFMFTFMPISIQALFCKVQWKPIRHTRALSRAAIEGK
ncbi:MAG: glycosyltransferase family 2 protein [Lachnospiraceae bacterium]|nr:glycosyltransferase family 2 protein [Lachnospiraceae bacterium]